MRDGGDLLLVMVQFTVVIVLTALLMAVIGGALWILWTAFDIMGGIVGVAWLTGCVFVTWRIVHAS